MLKQFQRATWKIVDLVNSPRKTQKITRNAVASRVIFDQYLVAAGIVDARGFCAGSLAEMSMRVAGGKFLINPSGVPLSLLDEETLLFAGVEKIPQDEELALVRHATWHQHIYQHSSAAAVLLCQPRHVMAILNKRQIPPQGILRDADALIKRLKLIPQDKVNEENIKKEDEMWLIPSSGVILWGKTLAQLVDRVEMLESVCAIFLSDI